jgi:hypothetical protein
LHIFEIEKEGGRREEEEEEEEREREREREERMFNLKCKMLSHIYLRILILP